MYIHVHVYIHIKYITFTNNCQEREKVGDRMSDSESELETHVLEDSQGAKIGLDGGKFTGNGIEEGGVLCWTSKGEISDFFLYRIGSRLVLDEEGLKKKIAALDYGLQLKMKSVPFIETLAVVDEEGSDEKVDYKDNTKRESYFYSNTLRNVSKACLVLASMNVKWNRPDDMLAEMLKTDQHMKKIKMDLLKQEQKIKAVELKKQKYVEKKFTKKIQVEKKKQRMQEVKKNLKEIEKWKKSDHKNSASIEESFDKYFSGPPKHSNKNKKVVKQIGGNAGKGKANKRSNKSKK